MNINQDITDYRLKYRLNPTTNQITSVKENLYFARHTFNFSTGLNTKLYGTFPVDFWGIVGFRHVMSPSLSFTYAPDFSEPVWGYYQFVEDTLGIVHKYDHFSGQSLLGGTPGNRSENLSINLSNIFQMKQVTVKDEKEETQKIDLFSLNFASSYNFIADSLNWGNLSSSFRAEPIKGAFWGPFNGMTVDLSSSHSFYNTQGSLLRLLNFNANANLRFASKAKSESKVKEFRSESSQAILPDTSDILSEALLLPDATKSERMGKDLNFKPISIPWDWNASFRYNWTHYSPLVPPNETIWLENNFNIKLTKNWSVSYNNRVDLLTGEVVSSGFSFYRDLHCWEGRFIWNPTGVGQGFFIKINVKASGLQDLKIEKRKGVGGFF
jgi:hypothetical protein